MTRSAEMLNRQRHTFGELAKLLAPRSVDVFLRDCWETRSCVIRRRDRSHYRRLLAREDVDSLLSMTRPHTDVSVVRCEQGVLSSASAQRDASGAPNMFWLYTKYHEGFTVVVNGVNTRWAPVRDLCRHLETDMGHRVGANLYFSPPSAQGFAAHFDDHDVFVLQLAGSKRWRLFPDTRQLPLPDDVSRVERRTLGKPREVRLRAGDLLYLPRGAVHEAVTSDEASLHLTVGIYVTRWIDVMLDALRLEAARNIELRKGMPVGQSRDGRREIVTRLHGLLSLTPGLDVCARAIQERERRFVINSKPIPDGHFDSLDKIRSMHLSTRLTRRNGMPSRVTLERDRVVIRFPGNSVSGPPEIERALRFISGANEFTVAEIPNELSDDSKVVLAARMVREGLFSVRA